MLIAFEYVHVVEAHSASQTKGFIQNKFMSIGDGRHLVYKAKRNRGCVVDIIDESLVLNLFEGISYSEINQTIINFLLPEARDTAAKQDCC